MDEKKLEVLFNKTKEAALIHKTYFDELATMVKDDEKFGYCLYEMESEEVKQTLIDAQNDISFSEFVKELEKHRYYPALTDDEWELRKEKEKKIIKKWEATGLLNELKPLPKGNVVFDTSLTQKINNLPDIHPVDDTTEK